MMMIQTIASAVLQRIFLDFFSSSSLFSIIAFHFVPVLMIYVHNEMRWSRSHTWETKERHSERANELLRHSFIHNDQIDCDKNTRHSNYMKFIQIK